MRGTEGLAPLLDSGAAAASRSDAPCALPKTLCRRCCTLFSLGTPPPPSGVVWGWCVAGLAFLPYALWVLAAAPLLKAVGVLLACLLGTLGPLALVDRHFYGRWTVRSAMAPRRRRGTCGV